MRPKLLKRVLLIACAVALLSLAAGLVLLVRAVEREAHSKIERGAIQEIIYSESPVFFDDGKTPIGVLFERTHRKYIPFDAVPKHFIKALVAAEDARFFEHPGIDLRAVARATLANLRAGRVIQGGSTITQQTAKNIFRRERRSFLAKVKELIQALLLERRYSKEAILEIYVNQFFVTAFGKGLEIASNYFFDKNAKDIDLTEAAFIAGSVQAPNRFNPFIKRTEAEKREARRLAQIRKDYVLERMRRLGFITEAQYRDAVSREVPFKEGRITYPLNVLMDYIRDQLESDKFQKILRNQGIENIATSGIQIHTSVNFELQDAALRSLRRHLPLMDARLKGLEEREAASLEPQWLRDAPRQAHDSLPFLARITHLDADRRGARMVVAWEGGGGIIQEEGLKSVCEAWHQWKSGGASAFGREAVTRFLRNFHVGDVVAVRLEALPGMAGEPELVLTKIPALEGGLVVLQGGKVRAMVGGYFDRFFNRAVDARRQLGSIFKPIVFTAAAQLKWNTLDPVENVREVFRFQNTAYSPRPDHEPVSPRVSMAWAGAKSENLAAVWLLYHLTDHLNMAEFRKVAELVGLTRKKAESYEEYTARIRDRHGVVMNRQALMDAAFEEAKQDVVSDMIFEGYEEALKVVHRLSYDRGNARGGNLDPAEGTEIYRLDYRRLRALQSEMKGAVKAVEALRRQGADAGPGAEIRMIEALRHFYKVRDAKGSERVIFAKVGSPWPYPSRVPLLPEDLEGLFSSLQEGAILVDGLVPGEVLDLLQEHFREKYRRLLIEPRYSFDTLARCRDFRCLVNLLYLVRLSRHLGISSPLDGVLSFPLGANSISIMEAALFYQGIMTGKRYPVNGGVSPESVPIITKILDREGEVLWEYAPSPQQVLSPQISGSIAEILKKVMEVGTGRGVSGSVRIPFGDPLQSFDYAVPLYGKTGTANRFTSSSFVGFIPGRSKNQGRFSLDQGYVIASYVGFDDNQPMKSRHHVIYGASGALPIWVDTANAIVRSAEYRSDLQPADLAFMAESPVMIPEGLRPVPVSPVSGLVEPGPSHGTSPGLLEVLAEAEPAGDGWSLIRRFEPIEDAR